jgi:cell division protein ZapA
MPLVNVMVNSRAYTIACDEGEEGHLKDLASHVDSKVRELLSSVGQVGDLKLLLMAALLIADEHHSVSSQLEAMKMQTGDAGVHSDLSERLSKSEAIAADTLELATKRLEDIAARLGHA